MSILFSWLPGELIVLAVLFIRAFGNDRCKAMKRIAAVSPEGEPDQRSLFDVGPK